MQITDQNGLFTVTLGTLPNATYQWRVDDTITGEHPANYLANSDTIDLTGEPVTEVGMGLMRAGDANNDNLISIGDFNILKVTFGLGCGDPQYDNRADFTGDCMVSLTDFSPLKTNYGQGGAP